MLTNVTVGGANLLGLVLIDEPLSPQELNFISDMPSYQPALLGLPQFVVGSSPAIRGTRSRTSETGVVITYNQLTAMQWLVGLRRMDPQEPTEGMERLMRQLINGIPEKLFWKKFVQCIICQAVMFREGVVATHQCSRIPIRVASTYHMAPPAYPQVLRRTSIRARAGIHSVRGDEPERRVMRPLRSSSFASTEISSDHD